MSGLRVRTALTIGAGGLALAAYGRAKWWQDGFTRDFRTVDEGWFGENTNAGGTDKLGHAFSNYVGTRVLARTFEAIGHPPADALRLGFITTVSAFTAVEVLDGFSRRWRFSPEDAIANVAGASVGYLLERHPGLDRTVDIRLLYRASTIDGQRTAWDPLGDYSGQTWLLALKAEGWPAMRAQPALRHLELLVGYRASGYELVDGQPVDPRRDGYIGIGINLSALLDSTVFRNRRESRVRRATAGVREFVQVPGTAALHGNRF